MLLIENTVDWPLIEIPLGVVIKPNGRIRLRPSLRQQLELRSLDPLLLEIDRILHRQVIKVCSRDEPILLLVPRADISDLPGSECLGISEFVHPVVVADFELVVLELHVALGFRSL